MGAQLAPLAMQRFFDNNNNPLAGGQLFTYQAGTTTPAPTYADSTSSTANTNPVVMNARGEASVWLLTTQAYKFVLEDANGNLIWSEDNITAPSPVAVGNMTDEKGSDGTIGFAEGVDFTPGMTMSLTLSQSYGSASNLWVAFDAAEQGADQYSLSGRTLTFNSPIPVGTNKVYVKGGLALAIGTPGNGTVTDASIAPGSHLYNRSNYTLYVRDFGAKGDGITDDTAAFTAAIAAFTAYKYEDEVTLYIGPGQFAVTNVTFPSGPTYNVDFAGGQLLGIASVPTNAVLTLQMEGSTFRGIDVNMNFNSNYQCGIWWYNATASSQYNFLDGVKIKYGVRGMIYGALVGNTSTTFAQSENSISGWRTRGVQNPFYGNHQEGFLFFSDAIFVCNNEEWAGNAGGLVFSWTTGRCLENASGWIFVQGGEIEKAGAVGGYACDLSNAQFSGMNIETACPVQFIDSATNPNSQVRFENCRFLNTQSGVGQFYAPASVNQPVQVFIDNSEILREAGVGAYDRTPMCDVSAATTIPGVYVSGCNIQEWAMVMQGNNCPLVNPPIAGHFRNTRLNQTYTDNNVYEIDTTRNNLLDIHQVNTLCYNQSGWYNNTDSGTTSVSINSSGPPNYNAISLGISATGVARIIDANEPGGSATLEATAHIVRPGELYTVEGWANYLSGTSFGFLARFYAFNGSLLQEILVTDQASLNGTNWTKVLACFAVPSTGGPCYMSVGVRASAANGQFTDLRLRRA